MTNIVSGLLRGMVVETNTGSFTGKYLYSDFAHYPAGIGEINTSKDSKLNRLAKIPFVGIVAGVARVGLGAIHTVGHLFAALFTLKKGHLFHASKGLCEMLRGTFEAIPIAGRIFTNIYSSAPDPYIGTCSWWMIKIYNPEKPDGLDRWMNNWENYPRHLYIQA